MDFTFFKYIKISLFTFVFILLNTYFTANADDKYPVGLTADMPFASVSHQGRDVKIKRIQDINNRLVDDFAKTSRPCPPFCIHPMSAAPGVATIGELELIDFVKKEVKSGSGILVDARMPKFFNSETIPGAVNIPFILFTGDETASKIINLLGVKTDKETYDFTEAKNLCLFCNGPWCDQSPRAIKALIKIGYPADKLKYYRGGMQLWKSFSLTTVLPLANTVEGKKNDG
jgi:rhodanese-related sulfurtransferase